MTAPFIAFNVFAALGTLGVISALGLEVADAVRARNAELEDSPTPAPIFGVHRSAVMHIILTSTSIMLVVSVVLAGLLASGWGLR